jgi:hypothetical protein
MRTDATFLGTVNRVVGAQVDVILSPTELPSNSPIVDGRVYRLGQIGSFVRIPIGFLNVYGIVSQVGSIPGDTTEETQVAFRGQKTLQVQLVGEAYRNESFQRGLSTYPTLEDEVHVVTHEDLAHIYAPSARSCVSVGVHSASESLPANVDLDKLVTRHCAILGSTGSGKSNTVAAILKGLTSGSHPNTQVIVIDPHGEYHTAFSGISRVFRIDDPANPLVLPYWALSFDELAWFLVDRRSASESQQDSLLRDRLLEMRQAAVPTLKATTATATGSTLSPNDITVDAPIPFDLRELWCYFDRAQRVTYEDVPRTVEALIAEGNPSTLTSARFKPHSLGSAAPYKPLVQPMMGPYVSKMLARIKDGRFRFLLSLGDYDGIHKDLHDLLSEWLNHEHPITVFDLAGVPPEIIDIVVGLLARIVFEMSFWGRKLPGMGKQRPMLMVFEEAHSYLPSGEAKFVQGYARRAVQRILKEGRKYAVGAMVVSQRPSELDETILSQCGTFFALRLTNSQDQSRVKSTVPDDLAGLTNLLPALRTGEALVVGDAMQIPSRIRVDLVEPRPESTDPPIAARWREQREPTPDYAAAVTAWRHQKQA